MLLIIDRYVLNKLELLIRIFGRNHRRLLVLTRNLFDRLIFQ